MVLSTYKNGTHINWINNTVGLTAEWGQQKLSS